MVLTDPALIVVYGENDDDTVRLKAALIQSGYHKAVIHCTNEFSEAKLHLRTSAEPLLFYFPSKAEYGISDLRNALASEIDGVPVILVLDTSVDVSKGHLPDNVICIIKNDYHLLLLKQTIKLALVEAASNHFGLSAYFSQKCFDELPIPAFLIKSNDATIIKANRAAILYFNLKPADFGKESLNSLFKIEDKKYVLELSQLLNSSGTIKNFRLNRRGRTVLADLNVPDFSSSGTHTKVLFVQPGTELLESGSLTADAGQLIRKLAENYPNGIIAVLDRSLQFLFCEGKELIAKQLTPEFMIGKKYTDFLDEANRLHFINSIEPAFEGKQVLFTKEMGNESFLIAATGLVNAEGTVDHVVLVSQNITGSVLAKKEVIFQANILKNISDLVMVKDMNGRIVYLNESAAKMIGIAPEKILGLLLDEMNLFSIKDYKFSDLVKQLEKDKKVKLQFSIELNDGRVIFLESEQFIMTDEFGQPAYVIGIAKDVSERMLAEKVLKESEANLLAIFNSTSQTFILMNSDCQILAFNQNAENHIRVLYRRELKPGDSFRQFLLPERKEIFEENIKRVLNKEVVKFEQSFNFPGKDKVYIEITYSPVLKDGEVIGIIICAEDTTEKFISKETIFSSEKKYRELVETSMDMIWTIDNTGKVIFANKACYDILGWKAEDLIGTDFINYVGLADRERVGGDVFKVLGKDHFYRDYQSMVLNKEGQEVTVITNAVIQYDSITKKTYLTGTSRDISARVRAERELNEKNEQLKSLSVYLQTVREEERSHIAREIHDELGQLLTGLKMDLAWLNRKLGTNSPDFTVKIREMLTMVDETVKSVRKIASELRPGILDDLGLIPAIEWQCSEFEKKSGITCKFDHSVGELKLDRDVSTGVFRILQESMTNIARHADATEVKIELSGMGNEYLLQIADNGKGFKKDQGKLLKTLGLVGMNERASMLGGHLLIESAPEKGTKVLLNFKNSLIKPESE